MASKRAYFCMMEERHCIHASGRFATRRVLAEVWLACALALFSGCGSSNTPSSSTSGALTGNWQLSLLQEEPHPKQTLGVSGFLQQSGGSITGSVVFPQFNSNASCAGIAVVTGTVNGQSIQFSADQGGAVLNFTGSISSDNQNLSGSYDGSGSGCFEAATTGTWSGFLVPSLSGSFTGTLSDSSYMSLVSGITPPLPVAVSGELTQSPNIGASNATLQGTISAVGYPCFSTASMTGTISGVNVILSLFGANGEQIGTIGLKGAPALVSVESNGFTLTGAAGTSGLALGGTTATGPFGPCPPLLHEGAPQPNDTANVSFAFQ